MKSVSYADEEKWKRLQKMRKASKKASVRAKANEEVEVGEAYKAVTNSPDSLAKMNKRYKPVKKIKNPTDRPFRDRLKDPDYKVDVDEEKKALPKLKMYRKAGNLARAGDEKSMKRQTKMVSVLNKETEKGYKKAALDKLRDGGSPKHQSEEKGFNFIKNFMKEDEALAKVKADIIKKHGKGAIYDPKNPPKSNPQPKPKAQKPLTDKEKAHREVVARYGGEANYKAGRGLGT